MSRPWEQLDNQIVGDFEIFRVRRKRARSPRTGETHNFHTLDLPDWVEIVPLTDDGRLVMVEQFRHGIGAPSLEFPAGILDPGESPIQAAARELEEETGFRAQSLQSLGTLHPNVAIQNNRLAIILARGCTPTGQHDMDASEDLRVRVLTVDEVEQCI